MALPFFSADNNILDELPEDIRDWNSTTLIYFFFLDSKVCDSGLHFSELGLLKY